MGEKRASLGGRLSAVLVAAGSAVGLGNIWRFPYIAGENGGGAFLIIYIGCILLLGIPVLLTEFTIGRHTHKNSVGAYRSLAKRWTFLGYNSAISSFLILGFYFVVSGWTLEYFVTSVSGSYTYYYCHRRTERHRTLLKDNDAHTFHYAGCPCREGGNPA